MKEMQLEEGVARTAALIAIELRAATPIDRYSIQVLRLRQTMKLSLVKILYRMWRILAISSWIPTPKIQITLR